MRAYTDVLAASRNPRLPVCAEVCFARRNVRCSETADDCFDAEAPSSASWKEAKVLSKQREEEQIAHLRKAVREKAARVVIQELVSEHNARIEAGQPGIVQKPDGTVYTARLSVPRGEWGKRASKLIASALQSEREFVVRTDCGSEELQRWLITCKFALQRAIDALVAEEKVRR